MGTALEQSREQKLEQLRAGGIEPYPYRFTETHLISTLHEQFEDLLRNPPTVRVSGRVLACRKQGKLWFIDLGSSRSDAHIQVLVMRSKLGEASRTVLENLDLGDFLGVVGTPMVTRRGERSINIDHVEMLCKALRPLPKMTEHTAIADPEWLARMPEVDMLFGRKKEVLRSRAKINSAFRRILDGLGAIEIETPYLSSYFGGAEARPFTTRVNALKLLVYLQISPELELKRAVVGGFGEGVYAFARNFRNEGVDATHNPEFTAMEVYLPNRDYEDMMQLAERLVAEACRTVHGAYECDHQGTRLDFTPPWPRLKMIDLVSERIGVNAGTVDAAQLAEIARGLGLDQGIGNVATESDETLRRLVRRAGIGTVEDDLDDSTSPRLKSLVQRHRLHVPMDLSGSWGQLILQLFDRLVEPRLLQPCHVIDHPACSTVLCKPLRTGPLPNGEELVERFESFAFRMEISNAYSELNDPIVQERAMREQAEMRDAGHEEAMPYNKLFIESLQYGMPPCGGLGIGMDRIVMLLTDCRSIREVIAFPLVRP